MAWQKYEVDVPAIQPVKRGRPAKSAETLPPFVTRLRRRINPLRQRGYLKPGEPLYVVDVVVLSIEE